MVELKEVNGQSFLLNPKLVEMAWLQPKKEGKEDLPDVTIILLSSGKQIAVEGDVRKDLK